MKTYELTLTANYVADWDFNMAIRELIQNGTDQEILEPNNQFSITYENGSIFLKNTKSGLKINTLLLGRSTKTRNEETVGQFGEGYKIAALVLNRLGKTFTVYNHSKDQIWKTRFVNSRRWHDRILVFDVDDLVSEERGLIIEVGNVTKEEYENLQKTWLGFHCDVEKIHTSYGDILLDEEEANRIYVNGLYISCSAELKYGYDFKPQFLKLERDRMSCDSFDARSLTSKMLNEAYMNNDLDPAKLNELIDDDCDDVNLVYYADNNETLIEAYCQKFDEDNKKEHDLNGNDLEEVCAAPIPVANQSEYNDVSAMGGNPVFVSYRVSQLLSDVKTERITSLRKHSMNKNEDIDPKELLQKWYERNRCYIPTAAEEEFEMIMELL